MTSEQNNAQPPSSEQENDLGRGDSNTTSKPLTEEEMSELKKHLNFDGANGHFKNPLPESPDELEKPTTPKRDIECPQTIPRSKILRPLKRKMSEQSFLARSNSEHEVCVTTENFLLTNPQQNFEGQLWGNLRDPLEQIQCVDSNQAHVVKQEHFQMMQQTQDQQNWQDQNYQYQDQWQNQGVNLYGPTSASPCIDDFKGDCDFGITFESFSVSSKNKHWDYSDSLKKLFVHMNKYVLGRFNIGPNPPEGLIVRAVPIYAVAGFFTSPVKRCPNHASLDDPSNHDQMWRDKRDHLIRVDNDFAIYEEDLESKRLSVIIPVQPPQTGSTSFDVPLRFMCLGSDVGGINRKPLKVIFTLEHGTANVIARHTVDVRICSCPRRDRQQEEKRQQEGQKEVQNQPNYPSSSFAGQQPPPEKKKKLESIEELVLVPVAKRDFEAVNKHAEALMIARQPEKLHEIKNARKKLLLRSNPGGTFSSPMMTKPKHPY